MASDPRPMRTLVQPGPVHPQRIDSFGGDLQHVRFVVRPGETLAQALTAPLVAAGWQSGTLAFGELALEPFRYVMPGPPDGPAHVAYFTAPVAPAGRTLVQRGNAMFGWADGTPALHCHAAWIEPDGRYRGGHILPTESVVASETIIDAWGFRGIRVATAADAETNFTLFQPAGAPHPDADSDAVLARVRPNLDLCEAVETICRRHAMPNAIIQGSLGSLVGARFTDGRAVDDYATEVLVRQGKVIDGIATLDLLVVDMRGAVHEGRLARGQNAVLITFDLVLQRM